MSTLPRIKSILLTALLTVASFIMVVYTSCHSSDDKCPDCLNGATCVSGHCKCASGFTGPNCSVITCPICQNGGFCDSSSKKCICPGGYEGIDCSTESRAKFVGNWQVDETGSKTSNRQYSVSITDSSSNSMVFLKNMYNYFSTPLQAWVQGDTVIIYSQTIQNKSVSGRGYIYDDGIHGKYGAIDFHYQVYDMTSGNTDDYNMYFTSSSSYSHWHK